MKIGDFPIVETLVDARATLLRQRDQGKLQVLVDGRLQDQEFIDTLRPTVQLILTIRIGALERQLRELGVVID